mgnify:CR=1 FL=1
MKNPAFPDFVDSFRNSAPYINAHKGKTFVLLCGGEVVAAEAFSSIVHDIALLATLGVRLVVVHGSRSQVEAGLQSENAPSSVVHGTRVTDPRALELAVQTAGTLRARIEALLSIYSRVSASVRRAPASRHHTASKRFVLKGKPTHSDIQIGLGCDNCFDSV